MALTEKHREQIKAVLQENGLDALEDMVVDAVRAFYKVMPILVKATALPIDDLLWAVIAPTEKGILSLCDRIDGKDDEGY